MRDEQAEKAVLGCLILEGLSAIGRVARLREDMFSLDGHRRLYRSILEVFQEGLTPDYLMLADRLKRRSELDAVGGQAYIADLGSDLPKNFNVEQAVERIVESWKARTGVHICQKYQARFESNPADETLSLMQEDVFDALQEKNKHTDPLVIHYSLPALEAFLNPPPEGEGLQFGIDKLDSATGGMRPGEVTVIGARSGVGKSSLMCQVAAQHCPNGVAVDLYSLEMSRAHVLHRIWSLVSGVPYREIHRPHLSNAVNRGLVRKAALAVAEWPLRIYDDSEMTLGHIAAMVRMSARLNQMKLFCVDYAQIVNAEGKDERLRVAAVSRTLTKLAKSEGIHMMLLSQLRKVPAEQYARAPHIADLRETGQLENDAHLVALLHRGWDENSGSISYDAEILIPKQRNGVTGTIPAQFDPKTLRFQ